MKTLVKHTSRRRKYPAAAVLTSLLLLGGACSPEDAGPASGGEIPVTFTTAIQSVALPAAQSPATRTATDAVGQAVWTAGDAVSLFMLSAGGALYDDVFSGAFNKKYNVDPATGALSPDDGKPLYYPQQQAADFIAVWPYNDCWVEVGLLRNQFLYSIDLHDQTTAARQSACDLLLSDNARDITRSKNPVALRFRHQLSKLRFNIALGDGLDGGNITGVSLTGMNDYIEIDIRDGSIPNKDVRSPIDALKLDAPDAGADATFTAIVAPIEAGELRSREICITIDGVAYKGPIPDEAYDPGNEYTYPVTVQKSGVNVSTSGISGWTANDHGSGTATAVRASIEKVRIPAGTFMMGSPTTEIGHQNEETQHQVTLTKDFYMSKYEITTQQYAEFLNDIHMAQVRIGQLARHRVEGYGEQNLFEANDKGRTPKWDQTTYQWKGEAKQPMLNVTWYGAKAYADWIGGALPTEAQWEYACRAGTTTAYWFGDDAADLANYEWYKKNTSDTVHSVGEKSPNPWGLYDMHGNAREWCADRYNKDYYKSSPDTDPTGPDSDRERVQRGGSFSRDSLSCRSAQRYYNLPYGLYKDTGFRVVFVP